VNPPRRVASCAVPLGALLALLLVFSSVPASAVAEEASWSGLEQPTPAGSGWPIGLGPIGDIEFWAPNRGLLITAGEPPTIRPGVWAYNGIGWHELTGGPTEGICGATDGRIAWAGPDEFWTVSDGRSGQANEKIGSGIEKAAPLEDNTLCRFAPPPEHPDGQVEVVASYAHPANQPDSYLAMNGAACMSPTDCWFGGEPLEEPQIGAFHLHWNGSSIENEPYLGEGHAIDDMLAFEGGILESVHIQRIDRVTEGSSLTPAIHRINPEGVSPAIEPEEGPFGEGLDLYEPGEYARALDYLHLSAAEGALWAAAGRNLSEPLEPPHLNGQVTVVRDLAGSWTQIIGPQHPLESILPPAERAEEEALLGTQAKSAVVSAIAAEPGTGDAWIALAPILAGTAQKRAVVVHLSPEGAVLGKAILPSAEEEAEGVGPKGRAARLSCPAANDCWLATTQGWLFHLAPPSERSLPADSNTDLSGPIAYRPPDLGLPQVPPDAPPPDDSGLVEGGPGVSGAFAETKPPPIETKVTAPLLTDLHSRLVHRTTLELRFHLAVRARIRLLAERRRRIVASTPMRTFQAGNRKLLLTLNPHDWPTKLSLQTHALAPLPAKTIKEVVGGPEHGGNGASTETTGLTVLPSVPTFAELGSRP